MTLIITASFIYVMFFLGIVTGFYLCYALSSASIKSKRTDKKTKEKSKRMRKAVIYIKDKLMSFLKKLLSAKSKPKILKRDKNVQIKVPNVISQAEYGSDDIDSKRNTILRQREKEDESYNVKGG